MTGQAQKDCPLHRHYERMLQNKTKTNLAKLTIAPYRSPFTFTGSTRLVTSAYERRRRRRLETKSKKQAKTGEAPE